MTDLVYGNGPMVGQKVIPEPHNRYFAQLTHSERWEMRELCMRGMAGPMPGFHRLTAEEQDDILHGRCIYHEFENTVILDYAGNLRKS